MFQEQPTAFFTPSSNIRCVLLPGGARCDIAQRSYEPPPWPTGCPLDWGYALVVGVRLDPGRFLCASDAVSPEQGAVLPYGHVVVGDGVACLSSREGVRCETPNGHGFFVSRQRYEVY